MTRLLALALLVTACSATPRPGLDYLAEPIPADGHRGIDPARTGAPLMTLVVPVPTMPAEPAGTGVGVRSGGGAPPPLTDRAAEQRTRLLGQMVTEALTGTAADVTYQGTISYVGRRFGPLYLALPEPRGTLATICGPAGCVTRTSTDFGPDQRVNPDRIADLSAADWLTISGVPLSYGLTVGSVTILHRPHLPETSTP